MKSIGKMILVGFLVWLIPFLVAIAIYRLHEPYRPLFESVMAVVVASVTMVFAGLYLVKLETQFIAEAITLGIIWFVIAVGIDLLMFMWGPMKTSFADYMMDIGVTYVMIPVITVGFGWVLGKRKQQR